MYDGGRRRGGGFWESPTNFCGFGFIWRLSQASVYPYLVRGLFPLIVIIFLNLWVKEYF